MADISKSGTPSLATLLPPPNTRIAGLTAGEALGAFDACYIKNDGKVYKATGAAANAAAKVDGFAAQAYASGDTDVTLYWNVRVNYGSGLTPGARYYVSSATAGALQDAASTGGTAPVAHAVDATRIEIYRSQY
jgi:hypothetical protein